ncbi:MAG TPA: hypothetical protein VKE26_26425 [Xanthobacteraceae bacterium]|nr:hypothetical protein [Xanthobacteraceae bacterium]
MRFIIGIFIAFTVAVVAYDLGLRLPIDLGFQLALVGALALASWLVVSRLSDDEHAHHHH